MRFCKKAMLFTLGGGLYVLLELLWRGRSHITMFLAGGFCFLLICQVEERLSGCPILLRAGVGAGMITTVELLTGLLFNRDYSIWDYRDIPGNIAGQICPVYSLLWVLAALAAGQLYRRIQKLWLSPAIGKAAAPKENLR